MKMASADPPTRMMKTGRVLSQDLSGELMSGRARSGRRVRMGPEPGRGGGMRFWSWAWRAVEREREGGVVRRGRRGEARRLVASSRGFMVGGG